MKAILVKNDEFKTIGLHVTDEQETIFSWGISVESRNWCKEIDLPLKTLIELCELKQYAEDANAFVTHFFNVINQNKENIKESENGTSWNLNGYDKKGQAYHRRMVEMIQSIN